MHSLYHFSAYPPAFLFQNYMVYVQVWTEQEAGRKQLLKTVLEACMFWTGCSKHYSDSEVPFTSVTREKKYDAIINASLLETKSKHRLD